MGWPEIANQVEQRRMNHDCTMYELPTNTSRRYMLISITVLCSNADLLLNWCAWLFLGHLAISRLWKERSTLLLRHGFLHLMVVCLQNHSEALSSSALSQTSMSDAQIIQSREHVRVHFAFTLSDSSVMVFR